MIKKTLVAGIVIVAVGIAAFFWQQFLASRATEPVTRSNGERGSGELLTTLGSLEGLKFDTSFFDDRLYKSLKDFSPEIPVPQTKGSGNPFVPNQ